MNIQQLKTDMKNGVIVSRYTHLEVLDYALSLEAKIQKVKLDLMNISASDGLTREEIRKLMNLMIQEIG